MLIKYGAKVNIADKDGVAPLAINAKLGSLPCVQLLVSKGADINAIDTHGRSALYESITSGHLEVTKYLIDQKAIVNPRAFHAACQSEDPELVSLLINAKVKDNLKTSSV